MLIRIPAANFYFYIEFLLINEQCVYLEKRQYLIK